MELDKLLRAHEVEVKKVSAAKDGEERRHHLHQVASCAGQISKARSARGGAIIRPQASPVSVNCDAGTRDASLAPVDSHPSWDNEGGAIARAAVRVPDKAPLEIPARYFVGAEEYSDVTLAVEAHAKQKIDKDR
ncbi:hypothetical protein [Altererythrobacter sp. GH1-8]|uniref:hypothetical protein n=1 Tax=Altererythrobacter sp. GH1-8 TaxID=3349333 RepID=UPI00374D2C35